MEKIDTHDMRSMVDLFPQLLTVVQLDKKIQKVCEQYREDRFNGLCIVGMGGSGIAGEYLESLFYESADVPVACHKDSALPKYIDENWVTIFVSYSGDTEETLRAYVEATGRNCKILAVTSGGKLKSETKGINCLVIPPKLQPRAAFPILFSALLNLSECLMGWEMTKFDEICKSLSVRVEKWNSSEFSPKQMAQDILDRIPIFISSRLLSPVAYRAKTQINENSKAMAFHSELPESNHNEIEAFHDFNEHMVVPVFLRSSFDDIRISQRTDLTEEIYYDEGYDPIKLRMKSESRIDEMLLMTFYFDLVSIELAELRKVDPLSVEKIARLKSTLKDLNDSS